MASSTTSEVVSSVPPVGLAIVLPQIMHVTGLDIFVKVICSLLQSGHLIFINLFPTFLSLTKGLSVILMPPQFQTSSPSWLMG
jgi:hypothetical protein